jgi:hypothetical protein
MDSAEIAGDRRTYKAWVTPRDSTPRARRAACSPSPGKPADARWAARRSDGFVDSTRRGPIPGIW